MTISFFNKFWILVKHYASDSSAKESRRNKQVQVTNLAENILSPSLSIFSGIFDFHYVIVVMVTL